MPADPDRVRTARCPDALDDARTSITTSRIGLTSSVWADHVLECAGSGRAELLQDGGFPYLIRALGADIEVDLSGRKASAVAGVQDTTSYLAETPDRS